MGMDVQVEMLSDLEECSLKVTREAQAKKESSQQRGICLKAVGPVFLGPAETGFRGIELRAPSLDAITVPSVVHLLRILVVHPQLWPSGLKLASPHLLPT